MSVITLFANAVNIAGTSPPFTVTIDVIDIPTIQSVTVVPQSAPAGTTRTVTINATGATSYTISSPGIVFTPTVQPNVFTFVA